MFSTRCRGAALDTFVDCDTFATSDYYTHIPYLDVSSVYDKQAKQVVINVVNRHKDDAIATDIQSVAGAFVGTATVSQITSDGIDNKPYTYEARDTYRAQDLAGARERRDDPLRLPRAFVHADRRRRGPVVRGPLENAPPSAFAPGLAFCLLAHQPAAAHPVRVFSDSNPGRTPR